jgi:hypothetical protein
MDGKKKIIVAISILGGLLFLGLGILLVGFSEIYVPPGRNPFVYVLSREPEAAVWMISGALLVINGVLLWWKAVRWRYIGMGLVIIGAAILANWILTNYYHVPDVGQPLWFLLTDKFPLLMMCAGVLAVLTGGYSIVTSKEITRWHLLVALLVVSMLFIGFSKYLRYDELKPDIELHTYVRIKGVWMEDEEPKTVKLPWWPENTFFEAFPLEGDGWVAYCYPKYYTRWGDYREGDTVIVSGWVHPTEYFVDPPTEQNVYLIKIDEAHKASFWE